MTEEPSAGRRHLNNTFQSLNSYSEFNYEAGWLFLDRSPCAFEYSWSIVVACSVWIHMVPAVCVCVGGWGGC